MVSRLLTPNGLDARRVLAQGPFANNNSLLAGGFLGAELTGAWWLLRQDGTNEAGAGQTLSAVGSPGFAVTTLGGMPFTAITLNGTSQYYKTADVASPAGDMTLAVLVRRRTIGVVQVWGAKMSSVGGGVNYALNPTFDGANLSTATLYKNSGSGTSVNSSGTTHLADAWYLVALPYDFVTDGTSVLRLRKNGVAVGVGSTVAVGPMQAASGSFWSVGASGFGGGSAFLHGDIGLALMTEKVLSDATQRALLNFMLYWTPVTRTVGISTKGDVSFTFTPTWSSPVSDRYLLDALVGNSGVRLAIAGADGSLVASGGNGTAVATGASAGLSWVASTTYAIRLRWVGSSFRIYRGGVEVYSGTLNIPDQIPATWAVGAIIGGATNNCAGEIASFLWVAP